MIEETIRSFLAERLDVPVRLSVPTPAPARFVVVEKTGSGYEDGIYSATIAVQSYGPAATSHDGHPGCSQAQRACQGRHAGRRRPAAACALRPLFRLQFPRTPPGKRPRYQAVFGVVHY